MAVTYGALLENGYTQSVNYFFLCLYLYSTREMLEKIIAEKYYSMVQAFSYNVVVIF